MAVMNLIYDIALEIDFEVYSSNVISELKSIYKKFGFKEWIDFVIYLDRQIYEEIEENLSKSARKELSCSLSLSTLLCLDYLGLVTNPILKKKLKSFKRKYEFQLGE